ncbi:ESX secretion-associated protein EspG [Kutzneria buriramensis]|uniref:ESAT-6 protein secretion system EspG family protein n=1 Tax=Kutzneria buriramensis TaxID=1045776 RepID=A0A3E0HV86_9PSEU|nr:ESX secretion-associated protein EspG [Kutzneria buriramensis]REH50311.1 ESAT-6 protein secretion system EspG family protein [Kutzneria buriramensis]
MPPIAILPLAAFDIVWEDLRLGSVPYPFDVPSQGETLDERARIRTAVYEDLERHELARGQQLDPNLVEALRLLARPHVQLDTISTLDRQRGLMVHAASVANGQRALLAVQQGGTMRLEQIRDTALAASLVSLLPPHQPGPGEQISVPAAELAQPNRHSPEHQSLTVMLGEPVLRLGQFAGAMFDERGVGRRMPGLSWFDTEAGRYLGVAGRGRDGADWATVSPADASGLIRRLGDMISMASRR